MATIEELLAEIDALEGTPEATKAVFRRVVKTVDYSSLNPQQRKEYHRDLKRYRDYLNIMESKMEEGREEGRAEGRAEGEKNASQSIAKSMKEDGVSAEMISKYTGLSVSEIETM